MLLIPLFMIIGCNNTGDIRINEMKKKINQSTDILTSVNYQVITNKQVINEIDHYQNHLDNPIMIEILFYALNKGRSIAESFKVVFNEPTPFLQISGTSSNGVDHGYLDKNEEYVYYCTYTFKNKDDLELFINKAFIKSSWNQSNKQMEQNIQLPSRPFQ
ncbi:hypothetical protein ACFQI7_37150 [Paenibacillus allorhizosphaerae]|uniref:hypothetical protein n=1 Tax=Paenibacillus allorhizosphaerae TaxID=2849866 RepID=UPI001C406BAA|nr:hypothetical protein [Paenibacillus allorhizosphaerae]